MCVSALVRREGAGSGATRRVTEIGVSWSITLCTTVPPHPHFLANVSSTPFSSTIATSSRLVRSPLPSASRPTLLSSLPRSSSAHALRRVPQAAGVVGIVGCYGGYLGTEPTVHGSMRKGMRVLPSVSKIFMQGYSLWQNSESAFSAIVLSNCVDLGIPEQTQPPKRNIYEFSVLSRRGLPPAAVEVNSSIFAIIWNTLQQENCALWLARRKNLY